MKLFRSWKICELRPQQKLKNIMEIKNLKFFYLNITFIKFYSIKLTIFRLMRQL